MRTVSSNSQSRNNGSHGLRPKRHPAGLRCKVANSGGRTAVAVDIQSAALAAARELGAMHIIDARTADPVEAFQTFTQGGAQVSIDALGVETTCRNSVLDSYDTTGIVVIERFS